MLPKLNFKAFLKLSQEVEFQELITQYFLKFQKQDSYAKTCLSQDIMLMLLQMLVAKFSISANSDPVEEFKKIHSCALMVLFSIKNT